MMRWAVLALSHGAMVAIGFALGVYFLPILTAPPAPDAAALAAASEGAMFEGAFRRDLEGSDFLHWGDGTVRITSEQIVHEGALSPGPDYRVYLAPQLAETEEAFFAIKDASVEVGPVKTFEGFVAELPSGVDPADYRAVIIWCEAFSEFITAAAYQ